MSESVKYSTIRSTASKPKTATSSVSSSLGGPSSIKTQSLKSKTKTPSFRLPSTKAVTSNVESTIKTGTASIKTGTKKAETTVKSVVKTVEKTLSPIVTPIVSVLKSVERSLEKSTKSSIKTLQESEINKRINKLIIFPIMANGVSIISFMIIIFGCLLIYKEMNKDNPNQTENKHLMGKIVYETFNKEGFESNDKKIQKNQEEKDNNKVKQNGYQNLDEEECPNLNDANGSNFKVLKNGFCKTFNSDKVSDTCLNKRCGELSKDSCDSTSCCVRLPDDTCVSGNSNGPIFNKYINSDYYYFKGNKIG